jgi:hypothetical protein
MLSRLAKYVKAVVFSTMLTEVAASGERTSFLVGAGGFGVEISVGNATFISIVFGPATWGASVNAAAELADSLPQLLSQCRLQSSSIQSTPHRPSVTHEPHPKACRVHALASRLAKSLPVRFAGYAPALGSLGATLAQLEGAAVGACGVAHAAKTQNSGTKCRGLNIASIVGRSVDPGQV